MAKPTRNKIESAKRIKKYHCLKLVEGLMRGNENVAAKHLRKLIETRISNKLKHILDHDNLI